MPLCLCESDTDERTADGSLIELYRRMPKALEANDIHALLAPYSSVLELGSGTGRIADPLAALGHRVTAVDDSDEMLAEIRLAHPVCGRIENLHLAERFDAVVLATNLIHYRGEDLRREVLAAMTRHLKPTGKAIIQWKPPSFWAARPSGWVGTTALDEVTVRVAIHNGAREPGGLVDGEYTLIADGMELSQCFHLEVLAVEDVRDALRGAGLRLTSAEPETMEWLEAVPARS
ncbi:bifunctional 2-polyprenyl-6-hydroxyphenol methylase/3-demethylubiquinol 3-O-methyltransferase UbiG [Mycobacterium sp. DL592]|uniref:class I SAM-dependent methyltransferase n=1 Tax=Mycobacterium sp. DL592 TaxID=2675524 RepID=UPI001AAF640D|nr:class I SAM-dependent methyltransferase [Mycobacterium sp. DL592]